VTDLTRRSLRLPAPDPGLGRSGRTRPSWMTATARNGCWSRCSPWWPWRCSRAPGGSTDVRGGPAAATRASPAGL